MTFGAALDKVRKGEKVTRTAWRAPGTYVFLVVPEIESIAPFLAIRNSAGTVQPYVPGMDSMLADDWEVKS